MKLALSLIMFSVFAMAACDHDDPQPGGNVPACIQDKINELEAAGDEAEVIKIEQYKFNNRTVYFFTGECCDLFNYVLDSSCNYVCAPSGGISGGGDGACPDFNENATFLRKIWEK